MKREDFSGFTLRLIGYSLELVTVKRVPRVLALSRGVKTIFRIEV